MSTYPGGELELFKEAHAWKTYFKKRLAPYVSGEILEVGCGLGANTAVFADLKFTSWTCLEPDLALLARARSSLSNDSRLRFLGGTLAGAEHGRRYDCILYLDVLEHIEDDAAEAARAAALLNPGGALCVLAPAHQALFSPFDAAIGHYRRYSRASLTGAIPNELRQVGLWYMDSVGLVASAANRLLLRQSAPTPAQIRFWDGCLVPASRALDPVTGYSLGKSLVGVWRKP